MSSSSPCLWANILLWSMAVLKLPSLDKGYGWGNLGETMDIKQTIDFFCRFLREDVLYLLGDIAYHTVSISRRKTKWIKTHKQTKDTVICTLDINAPTTSCCNGPCEFASFFFLPCNYITTNTLTNKQTNDCFKGFSSLHFRGNI